MDLDVLIDGTAYRLSDGTYCKLLRQSGIGLPPLHRLSERGPQQDGDSDRGFRLDPRIVTLILSLQTPNMLTKRDQIMALFKPRNTALVLRWTRDDAAVRSLDCHYIDQAELTTQSKSRYHLEIPAQFKAANPTFYNPVPESIVFQIPDSGVALEIPLDIPWVMGSSVLDVLIPVIYTGTYRAYPVITISGPIANCVIENDATGEKLDWTGVTIAAGETRIVDLRYGFKTVVDGSGNDRLYELTNDSDLATWHLAEAPDAVDGLNLIHVTGSGCTIATSVTIEYLTRYVSL